MAERRKRARQVRVTVTDEDHKAVQRMGYVGKEAEAAAVGRAAVRWMQGEFGPGYVAFDVLAESSAPSKYVRNWAKEYLARAA